MTKYLVKIEVLDNKIMNNHPISMMILFTMMQLLGNPNYVLAGDGKYAYIMYEKVMTSIL